MRRIATAGLVLILVASALPISGCSNEIIALPQLDERVLIYGYVTLEGKPIAGAEVEGVSTDGAYRFNTTTDGRGTYEFKLPRNVTFNVTARHQGLRHTIWPVSVGEDFFEYNITLTKTPVSSIEGTGESVGGYVGYDNSQPLTGFTFNVAPVNGTTTLTPAIKNDKSYSVEVEPDVTYKIERDKPSVWFHYRNGQDFLQSVVVGRNETVLIDYVVVLP